MQSMKDNENLSLAMKASLPASSGLKADTLDAMYRGAIRKANENLQGGELFQAQIAIERALNQCQPEFRYLTAWYDQKSKSCIEIPRAL